MKVSKTPLGASIQTPVGELPIRHIIGIGRNYAEHASEQGADVPDRPMVFTKNPASLCVHGDDIVIPPCCTDPDTGGPEQVDFEAELGVVIAKAAKDVSEAEALSYVLGCCCANDVSARWWQKKGSGGQFCRGKSFDTFCPIGPVTPASEIPDVQALSIRCTVSDEVMQDASTSQMIFPVAKLIAELSRGTTLLPGTLILTGTPSGVGMARSPQRFLSDADVVEIEIEGLDPLENNVRVAM
jgi:2-keto-4-pentenoate hydratase/2-oxohepta-3-ene-1,7-dioic acid hydratase in catechol pathway